ncbi:MAG TPA: hemerythrin family protein [Candidatus Competibacteraceae bacterium]|nr:hemerythrin family protein [Candidatus Competibacteraceae bacterium]
MNRKPNSKDIDAEHHIQLGLTQALCDAVSDDADPALIDEIIEQLVAYSDMHFMSEQLLMRLSSYPGYDSHALDHDALMERLESIKQQYSSFGEQPFTLPEAKAILAFLADHINTQDRRFIDYYCDWYRRR